jgi:Family of unknown function (DUF6256)
MSSLVIKQSLVPMTAFYIVLMVVLAVGLRMSRRAAGQDGRGTARENSEAAGASPASPSPASPDGPGDSLAGATTASSSGTGATLASAAPPSAAGPGLERAGRRALLRAGPGWPRLIIQYARTVVGGYLVLMAVVVIYYFGVARVGSFIESAVTGCALLVGLSTPVFFLISWLTTRRG